MTGLSGGGACSFHLAIADERIKAVSTMCGVILEDTPSSHLEGSPILGILCAFDMPQAVGLMAPRKVPLVNPGHNGWTWPSRVYERLGCSGRFIVADTLVQAMPKMLA